MSIRILQVFNQYLEPGGEETWVNEITRLSGNGYEVSNLRFKSLDWTGNHAPNRIKQALRVWDNARSRSQLRELACQVKPDVLLFHNILPVGSLGLYDEAEQLGIPVIQYIHNFRPFSPSGTLWVRGHTESAALSGNPWPEIFCRSWEKSFLKTFLVAHYQSRFRARGRLNQISHWLAVSDFMKQQFIRAGISQDRISTLKHCWTSKAITSPIRTNAHYLFLGRLVPEKGTRFLIKVWTELERRLGDRAPRLVIAGSGPDEAWLRAKAIKLKRVVCVGHVSGDDKHDLLEGCKALLAPSIWWEPLGLIVHEAYDYGRPVLAANSGGLSETVIDGSTGRLHEPGNVDQLIDQILQHETLDQTGLEAMGKRGRLWLEQHATPEKWLDQFIGITTSVALRSRENTRKKSFRLTSA